MLERVLERVQELLVVRPALADLVELLLEVEQLLDHRVVALWVDDDLAALTLDVVRVGETQLLDAARRPTQQLIEKLEVADATLVHERVEALLQDRAHVLADQIALETRDEQRPRARAQQVVHHAVVFLVEASLHVAQILGQLERLQQRLALDRVQFLARLDELRLENTLIDLCI